VAAANGGAVVKRHSVMCKHRFQTGAVWLRDTAVGQTCNKALASAHQEGMFLDYGSSSWVTGSNTWLVSDIPVNHAIGITAIGPALSAESSAATFLHHMPYDCPEP